MKASRARNRIDRAGARTGRRPGLSGGGTGTLLGLGLALALLGGACGNPKIVPEGAGAPVTTDGGVPGVSIGAADGPAFDPGQPPSTGADAAAPPGAGETCAEEIQKAERVQVDLLLLIDVSDSMAQTPPGSTLNKYQLVRDALLAFVGQPGSAGLGLGLQFFPLPGTGSSCQTREDCGYETDGLQPPACQPVGVCAGSGRQCGARGAGCPGGAACVPLGRCTVSLLECTNLGEPCAGGVANDRCQGLGSACEVTSGDRIFCEPQLYELLPAPIAPLPIPGAQLVTRLFGTHGPGGSTPLRPAVEGALAHLRKHLAAHPGRKGVFVLGTDGAPSPGCANNTVDAVEALARAAGAGANAITTYVVGIAVPNQDQAPLQRIAVAGGGSQAFIIGPMDNLAQRFLETLDVIRGQSLPCEFAIPPSRAGGAIDFQKVNVRRKTAAADDEVLYAGSVDRCDPARGGWYYDADPATGAPTRVITCPATCTALKADALATVEIRFGCRTRTVD